MAKFGLGSRALRAALFLAAASETVACGDDESRDDTTGEVMDDDAGSSDGGARLDGSIRASDDSDSSTIQDRDAGNDPGCEDTNSCPASDPLAPFTLNCSSLPSTGTCVGGPREVLLVVDDSGHIAMFDPTDGHYLGVYRYPTDSYYNFEAREFELATQGPDQCIWTVSPDEGVEIERWNTDGTFFDKPLQQHYLPVSGEQDNPVINSPVSVAFTRDAVYVANESGSPAARLAKFSLPTAKEGPGIFDSVVLAEDDATFTGILPLGDGSLVLADNSRGNVIRLASDGTRSTLLQSELEFPTDVVYAGDGKVLVIDEQLGAPMYSVDLETRVTDTIPAFGMGSSNHYGMYPLKNGNWLISGGGFDVSAFEPNSTNPRGQNHVVWDDRAKTESSNFKRIGRACLPDAFVSSRAPTAPPTPPEPPAVCVPQVPAGAVLFEEDFNSGQFTNGAYNEFRDLATDEVTVSIAATAGTDGSGALVVQGTEDGTRVNGASAGVPGIQPRYISYDVRVNQEVAFALGGISFEKGSVVDRVSYQALLGTSVYNLYLGSNNSGAASDGQFTVNGWIHVEMRNINWAARTFDLYANCIRVGEGIYMPPTYGSDVDRIHMWNARSSNAATPTATAWFDNILVK